jgi:predicted metal-binding protein
LFGEIAVPAIFSDGSCPGRHVYMVFLEMLFMVMLESISIEMSVKLDGS